MHKDRVRVNEDSFQKLLCLPSMELLCFTLSHCPLFLPKVLCLPNIGARPTLNEARPGPKKARCALYSCRKMFLCFEVNTMQTEQLLTMFDPSTLLYHKETQEKSGFGSETINRRKLIVR